MHALKKRLRVQLVFLAQETRGNGVNPLQLIPAPASQGKSAEILERRVYRVVSKISDTKWYSDFVSYE
jgi:hypothetical protein